MARKETRVQKIVRLTTKRFPSFGGGKTAVGNPISFILKDEPPQFVAGVDIEQVVRFVLAKRNSTESARRKRNDPGNDARDISATAEFLKPLGHKALDMIQYLQAWSIEERLKLKCYPFSSLNKKTREKLLHLPTSWIREGAQWQLNSRKPAILLLRPTSAD